MTGLPGMSQSFRVRLLAYRRPGSPRTVSTFAGSAWPCRARNAPPRAAKLANSVPERVQ